MSEPEKSQNAIPQLDSDAIRALMERTLSGLNPNQNLSDHEQQAMELVYDAMEAPTQGQRLSLVLQALELDPENIDALLMLESGTDLEQNERIEVLRGIVATGANRLGEQAFKGLVPHFWGFIETRPYMRARSRLAGQLQNVGRIDEAILEYMAILDLNEGDNQGIRYELLPILLSTNRLEDARSLLQRFEDESDWSVVFAWGRVLERYLSGDESAAIHALAVARKQNAHIEVYLKGHRKFPKNTPGSYSPGSKEEALCFGDALTAAWKKHPSAVEWLISQRPHKA